MSREQYLAYQTYMKAQQEALSLGGARYPSYHKSRSPLLPGAIDQNQPEQLDDAMAANAAPLELRRVNTPAAVAGGRSLTIPQSLQSPGDRATGEWTNKQFLAVSNVLIFCIYFVDSPQVAQVYVPGTRFPHPHYPEAGARYYDNPRSSLGSEPPPAHRPPASLAGLAGVAPPGQNMGMVAPSGLPHIYAPFQKQSAQMQERGGIGIDVAAQPHMQQQQQQQTHREREQPQHQPRTLQNPGKT